MNHEIITIQGINCYEEDGVAFLNLEAVARGLGFTLTENKGGKTYCSVKWMRVHEYLVDLGFVQKWTKNETPNYRALCPDFIPENIFYRLAMKAKNETAEKFQALIANEVIPSIRKHGGYLTPEAVERVLTDPDTIIRLATDLKDERAKRTKAEAQCGYLQEEITALAPKAAYYDTLVRVGVNLTLHDAAKELAVKPGGYIDFLLNCKYLYRTPSKGELRPYSHFVQSGLFTLKESKSGVQTLITPKGRKQVMERLRAFMDKLYEQENASEKG